MDFANIKLPIAVIGIIVVQAFGIIWYVAQQDSTVSELQETVVALEETIEEMGATEVVTAVIGSVFGFLGGVSLKVLEQE